MKPLKRFEEFLKRRIVKRISPDLARSKSLISESDKRNKFVNVMLKKIGISDDNANYFIEAAYDTVIEIIRASMLADGYNASGEGAHEAEVSYMKKLGFSEKDVRFMNDLRYYRNGILYYGKEFDAEYANRVIDFLAKVYPKLHNLAQSRN